MSFSPETKHEVWVAMREDGVDGDGSVGNPYDGSSPTIFDARMRSFQEAGDSERFPLLIHLGPGVFQRNGAIVNDAVHSAWVPRSGWRLIGVGMYQTVIKLI